MDTLSAMLTYAWNFLFTLVSALVIWIFAWANRLQTQISSVSGRADIIEQKHIDLKELLNTRFDSVDQRLGRIERSLNGNLRKE